MYNSDYDTDSEDSYARYLERKCRFYRRQCSYTSDYSDQYDNDESYWCTY